MKKKPKINIDKCERMRLREVFDFLYLHRDELTVAQAEFIGGIRRQIREKRLLSEKQVAVLFDIRKALEADDSEIIIRQNF